MAQAIEGPRRARRILVVDDDPDNREMYAMYLARKGFEIDEAGDGETALGSAFSRSPDLIVLDLTLPDLDGARVIHALRSHERTQQTPIVVVSGYGRDSMPQRSTGSAGPGWDAYLTKPCLPDALLEKIRELLGDTTP